MKTAEKPAAAPHKNSVLTSPGLRRSFLAIYPLEVRYSSWTRVILDFTALANISVSKLRAGILLVTEGGTFTLLNRKLLSNVNLTQGQELQWSLEFQASIPQPYPSTLFSSYTSTLTTLSAANNEYSSTSRL